MKTAVRGLLAVALIVAFALPAGAAAITYSLQNLTGGNWRYSYYVRNDTAVDMYGFDVYFPDVTSPDAFLFSGLTVTGTPGGWVSAAFEPSAPDLGGLFTAFVTGPPLGPGDTASGFAVEFHYTGTVPLGSQFYALYDDAFNPTGSGLTALRQHHGAPEPAALALLGLGLVALAIRQRRKL